jgi:cell division septation protein DedD
MEGKHMSNNKTMVALLGVVAVLLAVIAGVLLFKPSTDVPGVDPAAVTQQPSSTGTGTPTGMPGGAPTPAPSGPFDPAKATKVPAGQTPQQFVEGYFKAITKGDYGAAFKMLPAEKQSSQTAEQFAQQLQGYGLNGYEMGKATVQGDEAVVEGTAKTSAGNFGYTWTLVKYKGGWVVKSRSLTGMGQ